MAVMAVLLLSSCLAAASLDADPAASGQLDNLLVAPGAGCPSSHGAIDGSIRDDGAKAAILQMMELSGRTGGCC
jgi:hypothetical protein